MINKDITVFAETTYRNELKKFGIKRGDRRRHMYLIGKTGMGKSTIQENMIVNDIRAGHGVAVVDPHGDLAEKVLEYIPNNRINDVVVFNPSDYEYPIAFNVVEKVDPHLRHLVASGLIGVFQKLWADSWGPRLEYILRNAILAVLDYPGATLLAITRMLSDKAFRKKVVENIQDPVVKAFWVVEFAGYNDKFASEAVSPIQNKVGQFLSTALIRNIVGQAKSTLDMREIIDEGKILILNLSKGRIGEDNSALLGAMMITKIQLAAMSRVDTPERDRKDFYLYVDEFQNFATESFASILSEARKYHLSLILAHQYVDQLSETVASAIFGNVGTLAMFRVGAADAEALAPEFAPTFTEEDLVNLPKYEIYLKLMIDGVASEPFSARGLMPLSDEEKTNNLEKVIAVSREKYAQSRVVVEDKINRWHTDNIDKNSTQSGGASQASKKSRKNDDIYKFSAKCNRCSKDTKTAFEPDGVRPVYCKDCLSIVREEKKKEVDDRKNAKHVEIKKINQNKVNPQRNIVKQAPTPLRNRQAVPLQNKQIAPLQNKQASISSQHKPSKTEEMSLDQITKTKPVDFRNKKPQIKNDFMKKDSRMLEKTNITKDSGHVVKKEQDFNDAQEVDF